jgi:hypothetical protein
MDNRLRRLAALLALAQAARGTPEGTNAANKAASYANKYGLSCERAQAQAKASTVDAMVSERVNPANGALWRASLAWTVAHYAGVEMIRHSGRESWWTIVGRPVDIDLWRALYNRAENEIDAEAISYIRHNREPWASARSEGDTFRKAAAAGFGQRLATYKAECEARNPDPAPQLQRATGALVLVGRELAVKAKVKELFPRLGSISVTSSGSGGARAAGRRFGQNMGVHRGSLK